MKKITIDLNVILDMLTRRDDHEAAVVEVSAIRVDSEFILTRDLKDFANSRIHALTPREYLALIE